MKEYWLGILIGIFLTLTATFAINHKSISEALDEKPLSALETYIKNTDLYVSINEPNKSESNKSEYERIVDPMMTAEMQKLINSFYDYQKYKNDKIRELKARRVEKRVSKAE